MLIYMQVSEKNYHYALFIIHGKQISANLFLFNYHWTYTTCLRVDNDGVLMLQTYITYCIPDIIYNWFQVPVGFDIWGAPKPYASMNISHPF